MRDFDTYIQYFVLLEERDRNGIRSYFLMSLLCAVMGATVFLSAPLLMNGEGMKDALKIGGTFVATLGSFPIKEILLRRDRMKTLRMLRVRFETTLSSSASEAEIESIKSMVLRAIEKTLA